MEELRSALGLGVVTLIPIGLVIYFGLKLNKAVQRNARENSADQHVPRLTLTGTTVYACMVGFWLICLVAGKFRPESSLGAFVGTADGVAAIIAGSLFFGWIAAAIFEKLGYPIVMKGEHPR